MIVLRPLPPAPPAPPVVDVTRDDTRFAPPDAGRPPLRSEPREPVAPTPVGRPAPVGVAVPSATPVPTTGSRTRVVAAAGAAATVIAGALAAAYWGWANPRVAFTNHLAVPVRVTVGAAAARMVAPGATQRTRTRRADSVLVRWEAMPPLENGQAAGAGLVASRGVTFAGHPLAESAVQATAVSPRGAVFQPLVTNGTGVPLRLVVNAGLSMGGRDLEADCSCEVSPGATGFSAGLHTLVANSSVRAIMPDGRSATFANLGGAVDRRSGVVRLRFTPGAFRMGG